jgi:hypothetical protein
VAELVDVFRFDAERLPEVTVRGGLAQAGSFLRPMTPAAR